MNKRHLTALSVLLVVVFILTGCAEKRPAGTQDRQTAPEPEIEDLQLTVGIAPGPVTYPLAHMAEKNSGIVLKPWQTGEQLTSMVTAGEVPLLSTPLHVAVLSYNKGLNVQLLTVSVWGMLYVMSTEPEVESLEDLKGLEIAIGGQGGFSDLIFRHLLIQNGIDPDRDLKIAYLDMPEASAQLVSGQLKYAVLNEPHSSVAALNARKGGVELHRVLDLTAEWHRLPGQEGIRLPMAGIIVVKDTDISPEQIAAFKSQYIEAAARVNDHPAESGPVVEKHVPWMKAAAVGESLKFARLRPESAADCRAEVSAFFAELAKTMDTRAFGGEIPDAGFYYQAD